mmetsp:Transcript_4896/g.8386  ORF Transcript_4896/g.8386 Transcript_4896/m.8386 type:complete len:213 (+) Transcript_4896:372-1010(+)
MLNMRGGSAQHRQLLLSARMRNQYDFEFQKKYLGHQALQNRLRSSGGRPGSLATHGSPPHHPLAHFGGTSKESKVASSDQTSGRNRKSVNNDSDSNEGGEAQLSSLQNYGPKHLFFNQENMNLFGMQRGKGLKAEQSPSPNQGQPHFHNRQSMLRLQPPQSQIDFQPSLTPATQSQARAGKSVKGPQSHAKTQNSSYSYSADNQNTEMGING